MQQLKEEKTRTEEKLPLSRYTSILSFSSIYPTRFEKRTPHIIFPRQKTPYRENFFQPQISVPRLLIGARYLDPEVGLWISPGPADQYWSPYAYTPNPVNEIDPDGTYSLLALQYGVTTGSTFGLTFTSFAVVANNAIAAWAGVVTLQTMVVTGAKVVGTGVSLSTLGLGALALPLPGGSYR